MKNRFPVDDAGPGPRAESIDQLIARYHREKKRRLVKRAMALWRKAESRHAFIRFDTPRTRIH